jgi:hypothetical protein
VEFIGRFDDVHLRPVFYFGYESMIRSFSSRFANRTLGWLILHLKKKDVGDNTQPPIASMETVREHNFLRMAFTLEHCWLRTTTRRSGYHPYMRTIMEISDNYCDLEHVFTVATTYWQEFMLR